MFLPKYEVMIKDTKSEAIRIIKFDEISVYIYGDAKYSRTEIRYYINDDVEIKHNLSLYIKTINDYFISNPTYKKYGNKVVNVFDFNFIKFVDIKNLIINSDEFQIISNSYPNLLSVSTGHCTISKNVLIGCLKCNYYDISSNISTLDSFNSFAGKVIKLCQTTITNMNKRVLNLLCDVLEIEDVNIDYEMFFLTTNAPKMRKIEVHNSSKKNMLKNNDLLFISGFFNLEYVDINGFVENYDQIKKLERLRLLRGILQTSKDKLNDVKEQRRKYCSIMVQNGADEERLRNYLQYQSMIIENEYLDFYNKLYIPRLERVKWENKISTKSLDEIKNELLKIYNMQRDSRKNISREEKTYTLFDSLHNLDFDKTNNDEQEDILVDSRPFEDGGIEYYIKRKKIIVDN